MAIIKLPNAGDTATLTITRCEVKAGNFGEQVAFSAGEDVLFVGKDTADRQLLRCGFDVGDYAAVVGSTLRFSREANSKKPGAAPFWNIEVSSAGEARQTAAPSKRLAPPTKPSKPMTSVFEDMVPEDDFVNAEDYQSIVWNTGDAPAAPVAPAAPARPSAGPSAGPTVSTSTAADDVIRYTRLLRDIATALNCAVTEPNVQGAAATLWIQWHKPAKGGY
jgi:hypothetical protein